MALSVPTWANHGLGHWIKTQLFGSMLSQSVWLKDTRLWARYLMVESPSPEAPQKKKEKHLFTGSAYSEGHTLSRTNIFKSS